MAEPSIPSIDPEPNFQPAMPHQGGHRPPSFDGDDRGTVIFDLIAQFGDQSGSDMSGGSSACQDFEDANDIYDVATIDNFTVTTSCEVFDIMVGLSTFNNCDVNAITGFHINIHSTLDSAETSMIGNYGSIYVAAGDHWTNLLSNGDYFLYFHDAYGSELSLLPILIPGEYWFSVVPENSFSSNGQTGITYSTIGDADAFSTNPNEGFNNGPSWDLPAPLSYTIGAIEADVFRVPEDYATIQEAINAANDGMIIEVGPGTYTESLILYTQDLTIISSEGPLVTTIQGSGQVPVVQIWGGNGLLSGFTIRGGGGAIAGGIFGYGTSMDIENSIITDNHVTDKGGGVGLNGCQMAFNDVVFSSNSASNGGGLYAYSDVIDSQLFFQGCEFIGNVAVEDGGGVILRGEDTTGNYLIPIFVSCTFTGNEAGNNGGAIAAPSWYEEGVGYHDSNVAVMIGTSNIQPNATEGCLFENNVALGNVGNGKGGAVFLSRTNYISVLYNNTFEGNTSEFGGGLYLEYAFSWVSHSRFFGNRAIYSGGAIELENSTYSIKECIIDGNYAERGAGIISNYSANVILESTLVVSNFSNTNGGGISMVEGTLYAFNSIFWNNYGANGTDEEAQVSSYGEPLHNFAYNSCVQGSSGESWNNELGTWSVLNTEPRFVDLLGPDNIPGTGDEDYHLIATSPCIDAGTNWPYQDETEPDYDLNARFKDDPYTVDTGDIYNEGGTALSAVIDIGPYEFVANLAGIPGDKIWVTMSGYSQYDEQVNWVPEMPIVGDRAILQASGSYPDNVNAYLNRDIEHSKLLHTEGAYTIFLENNTLLLDTNDGAEIVVGPFYNNTGPDAQLLLSGGTIIAERIEVHGEGTGRLHFSSAPTVKTSEIAVEPGAYFFVSPGTTVQPISSEDVTLQVQGILHLLTVDTTLNASLSLASTSDTETGVIQSQSGAIDILIYPDVDSWPLFSGECVLDGSLRLSTTFLDTANVGDSYVLFEAKAGIYGAFNCVVSEGFDDDRFLYVTIENTSRGSGQQVVAHVESASNLLGFGDPENTALAGNPADAQLADMDGDGIVDLVISLPGVDQVVVLLNGGNDPTTGDWLGFSDGSVAISVGTTPAGLALGDIAGDAAIDIAVACTNSDELWILENQYSSSGNFVTTAYDVGGHIPPELGDVKAEPVDVAIGNFVDGGGNDIAVVNVGDGTLIILGSTGLRSNPFGGGNPVYVGFGGTSVEPTDVNDTKDLDTVIISSRSEGRVAVVKGSAGLRGYDSIEYYDVGNSPYEVAIGDLNGDSLADIVTADYDDGTISVLIQNLDGTYQGAAAILVGDSSDSPHPRSIALGDYDVDGDLDVAVVVIESTDIVIRTLRNDSFAGTLILTIDADYGSGTDPTLVRSADVNNDTSTDIVSIVGAVSAFRDITNPEAAGFISNYIPPEVIKNDFCINAIPIFEGVTPFSTINATTDAPPEADNCKFGAPSNDIWYTFMPDCSGTLTISTCDTIDYDSYLALYSGSCESPTLIECNDDGDDCVGWSSTLVAEVFAGETYLIEIGGWDDTQWGSGTVSITLDLPVLQNVIFDQIGPDCNTDAASSFASQYFETSNMIYDIAAIEQFTTKENFTVMRVEVVINGWNGFVDPSSIQWYEINFYSSMGALTALSGDEHSIYIDSADATISETWQGTGFLHSFDIDAGIYAGDQFVSVISRNNFSEAGQVGIEASTTKNGDGSLIFSNPGEGFENGPVWTVSGDMACRLIGEYGVVCIGDIDGNGEVEIDDMLALIAAWGQCGSCAADINGDTNVDIEDLLLLISGWGPC